MEVLNAGSVLVLLASAVFFGVFAWERLVGRNKDAGDWAIGLSAAVLAVSAALGFLAVL